MATAYLTFSDTSAWVAAVTDALVGDIRAALARRNQVLVAIAGGHTPRPVLARLARADLPWRRVRITPTDDRLVSDEHPARNVGLLRQWLAPAVSRGARVIALEDLSGHETPDVVLLGFRSERHIASLVAEAPGMEEALSVNAAPNSTRVTPDPLPQEAPFPRISLTLRALTAPLRVLVAADGPDKLEAIERAQLADAATMPLSALLAQERTPVQAFLRH